MCIRDRYQRRVHGELKFSTIKIQQSNQSIMTEAASGRTAFICIMMVLTGALNTIVFKYQDSFHDYNHVFVQVLTMFLGEYLCLIFFSLNMFSKDYRLAERDGKIAHVPKYLIAIPAFFDTLTSSLQFAALMVISAAAYQMLRGGVIIITAIASLVFLGRKYYVHHFLGLALVVLGITLVGLDSVLGSEKQESNKNPLLGVILLLLSLISNGTQFIVEEKIFKQYHMNPIEMVGVEGFFGMGVTTFFIIIASIIPCSGNDACVGKNYENFQMAVDTIFTEPKLFLAVLAGMFSISFFNFFGLSVTKYVSSVARAVLDATRTMLVWIYYMVTDHEHNKFRWLQLVGFIILLFGNFTYNEIIEIPGLNKYTKRNLERETLRDDEVEEQNPLERR
eukprot:TRINITY_DN6252_c0_g2_i1.p1 TRINITY_DN6252_c0_g2~~TRINITY_DN6252_c0_g2_i1.p1  ORF type:complete len:392 (-),score=124.60 TRINITY_DN6252_c0_g2_i1:263-1438(-)